MTAERPPVRGLRVRRTLALVFGALGAAGLLFMAVGMALSGPWRAERSVAIAAAPQVVYPYLDSLALWDEWTVWGDMETSFKGPGRGVGASRSWDDPQYGSGALTLVESSPERGVRYTVEVEGGAMRVEGSLALSTDGDGTSLTWREEGHMGRNPLLGYVVRSMERSQGAEMERSLARLKELLEATR